LNLRTILGLALVTALVIPFAACEDTTKPPPPPPPPGIDVEAHYTKTFQGSAQTGLQSEDVYHVHVSTDNMVWIGNQAGLAVYDGFGTTVRSLGFDQNGVVIGTEPKPTQGLPNPKVRTMIEVNGKIYVGTWGGGIGVYDIAAGPEQDWQVIDESDGLVNNLVSDIELDPDGTLIIATNGGISKYDPVAEEFAFRWVDHDNNPNTPDVRRIVEFIRRTSEDITGDLLDEFVSAIAIAETPRGKEYWYCPRWEAGIDPGDEDQHGITVTRGSFNATQTIDTLGAAQDNTLYQSTNGDLSNGMGMRMIVGGPDQSRRRALVEFDIAAVLPPDATILEARLRLTNNKGGPPSDVAIHRALADWGESTSLDTTGTELVGAQAETGDATWLHRFYDTDTWRIAGGDFARDASASVEVRSGGGQRYNWETPGTAADVQSWLRDPSSNFGWIIVADDDTSKAFSTREDTLVAERPFLELTWSKFAYFTTLSSDLPEPNINDVLYDKDNDLFWLAFSTRGLAKLDVANSTWQFFTTNDGLPSDVIFSIVMIDGVIWVATQNGIARHFGDGTFRGYNRGAGLPANRPPAPSNLSRSRRISENA
jgi:hypothetical protein